MSMFATGCTVGNTSEASHELLRLDLSDQQLTWIGRQVYRNECASRRSCLVHWNQGEAFPSLGIGHFIWYPVGVEGPYMESFPSMVEFLAERGVALPAWLPEAIRHGAPWVTRDEFLRAEGSDERVEELRQLLEREQAAQTAFLLQRARGALERVASASGDPVTTRRKIRLLSETPGGAYALIDYVNFKGEGLAESERYGGVGWGLLQVLETMEAPRSRAGALPAFRQAAAEVLTSRAKRAGNPIEREQWLPGWLNRVKTYRQPES
jgi:hypothetical protein